MKTFLSSAVAVLLAATTSLCAQQQTQAQKPKATPQKMAAPFEQGLDLCADKFPAAYNAPARVDVRDCWDVFLTGSFLYWYVGQDGMDLAVEVDAAGVPVENYYVQNAHQSYHPGFKVGLGVNFDADNWVGYAEYTWMHEKSHKHLNQARWAFTNWFVGQPLSVRVNAPVESSWKVDFDMIDLVLSRPYYQGRKVTVSPFGGLRGYSLRQSHHVRAEGVALESTNKQKSWSVGLVSGMNTHWLLGSGFRMEGDFALGLLYNKFKKVSTKQEAGSDSLHWRNEFSNVRPTVNMAAGLGWGTYVDRQSYYLDLCFNYEFMLLAGQNMMSNLAKVNSAAPGDLYMHGLTAKMRFDF